MAYDQAASLGPAMPGQMNAPLQSGQEYASRSSHVALASAPAHAAPQSAQQAPSPNGTNPFSAEDYRRELARTRKSRKRKVAIVVLIMLVIAAIVALVFFTGTSARAVSGAGMEPVLAEGEAIITMKAREPHTGSVVAYHDHGGELQVKRVVAEAGDWVSVAPDGTVAVSDGPLSNESTRNVFGSNASAVTAREVPEGSYYVLGDAEDATADGLTSEADFIGGDQVVGEAVAKVWPITSLSLVS